MEELISKYTNKLYHHGLAEQSAPLFGTRDADLIWNKSHPDINELEKIFKHLNINSLLFSEPAEPYKTIIDYLCECSGNKILPEDCETRTFLHDLPITDEFSAEKISRELKHRKSVIVKNRGIVTFGTVSPEQAFVNFSSVCFACFVKFFSDYMIYKQINEKLEKVFFKVKNTLSSMPDTFDSLMSGPFYNEEDVYKAIDQAGKQTVNFNLVDSYFGNISYYYDNKLFISQTASSLDELPGCIDPCPLDNSSCAGITASSELSAHKQIILETDNKAILHGHPKFSVILSLICDKKDCNSRGTCHNKCPEKRFINEVPIVPGEVGTGKYGLCHTIPPAIKNRKGAIVYGHGVFSVGKIDFNEAFANLLNIEKMCKEEYFKRIDLKKF